ncbi:uncharacterized protein LOC135146526 [Zophobas morio]|uniref:uncharacterized protein LOC135146526 n=1 Tax=Zophobas morio TaxID=2755281 RepID=UPI0030829F8E
MNKLVAFLLLAAILTVPSDKTLNIPHQQVSNFLFCKIAKGRRSDSLWLGLYNSWFELSPPLFYDFLPAFNKRDGQNVFKNLMLLNMFVYILWWLLPLSFMKKHFALNHDSEKPAGRLWTFFTNGLSHANVYSLVLTLLMLKLFEGYIAEFWEGRSFYTFYFGTILAGSALSILWKYLRGQRGWSIGGGVAVMGLIGSMVELQQLDRAFPLPYLPINFRVDGAKLAVGYPLLQFLLGSHVDLPMYLGGFLFGRYFAN